MQSVEHIMKDLNMKNNFTGGKPGRKWLALFFKRHPECAKRTVEKLTKERENVTENSIINWFKEVTDYLKENNLDYLHNQPDRIFNCDETRFLLYPESEKVIGIKGQKNFI